MTDFDFNNAGRQTDPWQFSLHLPEAMGARLELALEDAIDWLNMEADALVDPLEDPIPRTARRRAFLEIAAKTFDRVYPKAGKKHAQIV